MSEKSINISLTKIFNYPQTGNPVLLDISFFSKKTSSLIIRKTTKSMSLNNCLNLAVNLRINYTQQQNSIIVAIQENSEENILMGEAEINLDELQQKKLKYFTIGDQDRILQAEVYEARRKKKIENQNQKTASNAEHHDKFIRERRKFLEKIVQSESNLKRNFSDRIMELISDSKSLKHERMYDQTSGKNQHRNLIKENGLQDFQNEQSKLIKSRSDQALNSRAFFNDHKKEKKEVREIRDRKQSQEKSNPSQKHKLMLNTLNVVQTPEQYSKKSLFKDRY